MITSNQKYPTRAMVQATIRKLYTLRELYSEDTLLEMITDEMYEGIIKWQKNTLKELYEELPEEKEINQPIEVNNEEDLKYSQKRNQNIGYNAYRNEVRSIIKSKMNE